MERMQWFIVGNLVGIAVLIAGIYIKESGKSHPDTPPAPYSFSQAAAPGNTADKKPVETVRCVTALKDIVNGKLLKAGDIGLHDVDKSRVPADAVLNVEDAIGKTTKSTLLEGEVVTAADLGPAKSQ